MSGGVGLVLEKFGEFYEGVPEVIVSAPGRLDFLNTHQDYKGLPVVSIGVNLRTYVGVSRSIDESVVVSLNLLSMGREYVDRFGIDNVLLRGGRWFGNYIRAGIIVLRKYGFRLGDFNALIYSDIPIGAGLASSAALLVSFIGALNELYGLGLGRRDVAELAYRAEHDIMGIPCGRLDQYGSVFGGVLKIGMRPPYNVEELPGIDGVFVVLDSGIRHSTADIHPRRQAEINQGLRLLLEIPDLPSHVRQYIKPHYYETLWERIDFETLKPYIERLPDIPRRRILFTFKMNLSTMLALEILHSRIPGLEEIVGVLGYEWGDAVRRAINTSYAKQALIGLIMNYQHTLLRDYYDVSLPSLEKIRGAALKAGALGVKLSGAGLGGSLIALALTREEASNILYSGIKAGAKRGWIVGVDEGLRLEYRRF